MSTLTIYDATGDVWKANVGPSINPVPSDQYLVANTPDGLTTVNVASQEMAGGLISANYALPAGIKYAGMDVTWNETAEDLPHKARNEMDLKWTFAGGAQANGSCQWNATRKMWQLDPTGAAWMDSGFQQEPVVGLNVFQLRLWSDAVKWTVQGIRLNGGISFTPGSQFANLPMIATNWAAGLHPQLQTECTGVPWYLRSIYTKVLILGSDAVIPM